MKSMNRVVCGILAHRLDRDRASIHPWQNLALDLDVSPLELVQIALEVEELENVIIPTEELARVETVGELVSFLSRSVVREKQQHHYDFVA
jgi:acyl carrier protein